MPHKFNLGLNLGIIQFEIEDILNGFGSINREFAGSFLLVERKSGLALEVSDRAEKGCRPTLSKLHGGISQQWLFHKYSKKPIEISILSVSCGLALDRTQDKIDKVPVVCWEENGEAWQRWKVKKTYDKFGWQINSVYDGRSLDVGEAPNSGDEIWMWTSHCQTHQQFLILPFGKSVARNDL